MSYADTLYGALPGPAAPAATEAAPTPTAGADAAAGGRGAAGGRATKTTAAPTVDRRALGLLVAMVGVAVLLTQVTVRGELEVAS